MILYLIKSSLLIVVFYLYYLLVIRNQPLFRLNRLYLLTALMLSVVLPLLPGIRITPERTMMETLDAITITHLLIPQNITGKPDLINPAMIIYLSGVCWFALRFITSLGRIFYLCMRFPVVRVRKIRTVLLPENEAPFTFFHTLFISKSDYESGEEGSGILEHELSHIRQWHSLDVMLFELASVVFWFNPFIWLMRSAIKTEHEYAADEQVVKKGHNALAYQQLLLERNFSLSLAGPTNHFNRSLLKNRFNMINTHKTPKKAGLRYWTIFPLLAFVCTVSLMEELKAAEPTDSVYFVAEVMPEYPGGMEAVRTYLANNLIYPEIALKQKVEGRVYVQFVVNKDGKVEDIQVMKSKINQSSENEVVVVGYAPGDKRPADQAGGISALEAEAYRVVSSLGVFKPGSQDGKLVRVQYTLPIVFALQ
jgi:hypothetical protein